MTFSEWHDINTYILLEETLNYQALASSMITFKPKQVTKKLLAALPERARDVLTKRYGLNALNENFTLEAIGQSYGITRERVRQIENYGIASIQKSPIYAEHADLFAELHDLINQLGGGVVAEHVLLDNLAPDESTRNHLYFILVVGDAVRLSNGFEGKILV